MPKHQPSEVRRAQLFEAALAVCADKGYHATRVDDIAARAGLSKGSLYHHFGSKEELFLAAFNAMIDQFAQVMDERLSESSDSALEALHGIFDRDMRAFAEAPGLLQGMMEFYLLGLRKPGFRELFLKHYSRLAESTASYIRRGIEQGEVRGDIDPDRVAWTLITGGDGLVFVYVTLGRDSEAIDRCMELIDLMIRGLRA